jgi:integrase/recombinase XerD
MHDLLETFLAQLGGDGTVPRNTVTAYRTDLSQFFSFATGHGVADADVLGADTMQDFCEWLRERGYSAATIARRIAALRAFGNYLVHAGVLKASPAEHLRRPSIPRRIAQSLPAEDLQALRAATLHHTTPEGWRDRALVEILAATGLRASALVSLDVVDIALQTGTLTVRSGHSHTITYVLTPDAVMALVTYLQLGRPHLLKHDSSQSALFLNVRGRRLTRQGCWEILQKYARQLHLDGVSLEQLRLSAKQQIVTAAA